MYYFNEERFYQYLLVASEGFSPESVRIAQIWDDMRMAVVDSLFLMHGVNKIDPENYLGYEHVLANYEKYGKYEILVELNEGGDWFGDPRGRLVVEIESLVNSVNEAASALQVDLELYTNDSPEIISGGIVKVVNSFKAKDEFLDSEVIPQLLNAEPASQYASICKGVCGSNSHCGIGGIVAAQEYSSFISGLYDELGRLSTFLEFIISNKESIMSYFNGRNISLATGELDWAKIKKLLKKDFAYGGGIDRYVFKEFICLKRSFSPASHSASSKGQAFEVSISRLYESLGYRVTLTKASGDFGVDIIAESNSGKIAIQCKSYESLVGVDAVMQIYSGVVTMTVLAAVLLQL